MTKRPLLSCLAISLIACGGRTTLDDSDLDGDIIGPDGGVVIVPDSGVIVPDSGVMVQDGGVIILDASLPPMDASEIDAGPPGTEITCGMPPSVRFMPPPPDIAALRRDR